MSANETNPQEQQDLQKVDVLKNGPLIVHGDLNVVLPDGSTQVRKQSAAFCRCGASATKPYCDGTHRKSGFEG